jgi:prolipoprotein diacylglyceryltransferase
MTTHTAHPRFPRDFHIGAYWINSYKFFLIVGIYVGSLTAAALGQSAGLSPLRIGLGAMSCALCGLIGARLYHVLVYASYYLAAGARHRLWDVNSGGWSVFGALLTFVPAAMGVAWLTGIALADFLDYMGGGVLVGGMFIRLGCVFNGCCVGRETRGWFGVVLHDIREQRKRRLPVQFFEIAWWLIGAVAFFTVWPTPAPPGTYALAVVAWYGVGRFFLEPMREAPDLLFGRIRVNQVVAAALAVAAVITLIARI